MRYPCKQETTEGGGVEREGAAEMAVKDGWEKEKVLQKKPELTVSRYPHDCRIFHVFSCYRV